MSQPTQEQIERITSAFIELGDATSALLTPNSPLTPYLSVLSTDISKAWAFFRVYVQSPFQFPPPPPAESEGSEEEAADAA